METATARSIIDCALEIIYLLNGEDYRVIQVVSGVCVTPIIQLQKSITQSPPHSTLCQKKILELTSKITELVTKEVPLRCQDVALYFSMEEWDYVEGHRDRYLDLVVEENRSPTSPDGRMVKNPLERCPSPLCSQDCSESHQGGDRTINEVEDEDERMMENEPCMSDVKEEAPEDDTADKRMVKNPLERCPSPLCSQDCTESHQGGDRTINEVEDEDEWMMEDLPCMSDVKEEAPEDDTTENPSKNFKENFMFLRNSKAEGEDTVPPSSEENLITLNVHPEHIPLISCNDSNLEELSPDPSQMAATTHTSLNERRFQCGECGEEFSKNSDLYTHRKSHKSYSCSECGMSFTDTSLLVMHENMHTWENPYSCSKCGKRFSQKSDLVTHEKNHGRINNSYKCAECGKSIATFSALTHHQRRHAEEIIHSCSDCGKCFAKKDTLVNHMRTHTGEKPFSCSDCGKSFTRKAILISHEIRNHTGNRPFACLECKMCFAKKSYLTAHKKSHTGEKPYSCSECGKCFINRKNLNRHKRTHAE